MAHDLTALRQARALAIAGRAAGVADKHLADLMVGQGIAPEVATIIMRLLDVEKAIQFAANGRRDIHYGLLTVGSAAVVFLISLALPILPIVFGTAVLVGLAWMGRGFFFRWRAERIAPGIYSGKFRETFGGHSGDMIQASDDVLAERAGLAVSVKRARTNTLYFSYLMTGVCFLTLLFRMSTVNDDNAFIYVMVLTFAIFFATMFASAELLFRAENLPPPRPFAKKKPPAKTDQPVTRYSAPHFSDGRDDNAVIFAAAHSEMPAQGAAVRHKEDMVFGVLNITTQGIVYLPDVPVDNPQLRALGRVAVELAASAHPALEVVRDIVMEKIDVPETLPDWIRKALDHPLHFVIAWSDLVETGHDPGAHETTLVKDTGDGNRQTFKLIGLGNLAAPFLFRLKLDYERRRVFYDVVIEPRYRRIEAELTPHFTTIYGDKVSEHAGDLHNAVIARLSSETEAAPADEAEINRRLAPLMPAMLATPLYIIKDGELIMFVDDTKTSPPAAPPANTAKAAG